MFVRLGFSLKTIVVDIIGLYTLCICLRTVLSWVLDPYSKVMSVLVRVTEPVIMPVRNTLNRIFGTFRLDFSPVVTVVLLEILRNLILKIFR